MCRSTFSTTTIASSTTMPIASTRPNSESMLSEKPNAAIAANVPISETGIAISGIRLARQFCKKHEHDDDDQDHRLEQRVNHRVDRLADEDRRVVDDAIFEALGKASATAPRSSARTPSAVASALEPGRWAITSATAGSLLR